MTLQFLRNAYEREEQLPIQTDHFECSISQEKSWGNRESQLEPSVEKSKTIQHQKNFSKNPSCTDNNT